MGEQCLNSNPSLFTSSSSFNPIHIIKKQSTKAGSENMEDESKDESKDEREKKLKEKLDITFSTFRFFIRFFDRSELVNPRTKKDIWFAIK